MLHRLLTVGTLRVAAAALALSLATVPSAFAKGGPADGGKGNDHGNRAIPDCSRHDDQRDGDIGGEDKLTCPGHHVLVRTEQKLCPDKPGRPAVVRKRVCCQHGTMISCRPFRPCPPRSPS